MTITIKANSLNTSIFGNSKTKDGISVVPSHLMRNPSTDFAIEKNILVDTGIFSLAGTQSYDSSTHKATITITSLEGYFQSAIGKHYIKTKENAILDLVGFQDGNYILSLEVVFVDGGDTDLNFHINNSSNAIIGEKLADIGILSFDIYYLVFVPTKTVKQFLRDHIDTYSKDEVRREYLGITAKASDSLLFDGVALDKFSAFKGILADGTDLNTVVETGIYDCHYDRTYPNAPEGMATFILEVVSANSDVVTQRATIIDAVNKGFVYTRTIYGTTPTAWKKVLSEEDDFQAGTSANSSSSTSGYNGYQKLPSGVIIQWGRDTATPSGANIPFNIAFSQPPQVTITGFESGDNENEGLDSISNASFIVKSNRLSRVISWIAIGY